MTGPVALVGICGVVVLLTMAAGCLIAERVLTAPLDRPTRFSVAGLACCALALVPLAVLMEATS